MRIVVDWNMPGTLPVDTTLQLRNLKIPDWQDLRTWRSPYEFDSKSMAEVTAFRVNARTPDEQRMFPYMAYSWMLNVIESEAINYFSAHTFRPAATRRFAQLGFRHLYPVQNTEIIGVGSREEMLRDTRALLLRLEAGMNSE